MCHGARVMVQLFGCVKNKITCSFPTMKGEKERKKGRQNEEKRRKKPKRKEGEKKK
jgi:hypothetical protein